MLLQRQVNCVDDEKRMLIDETRSKTASVYYEIVAYSPLYIHPSPFTLSPL